MSLRTSIPRRGKAAISVTAFFPPVPRETLPFLYPRWARTITTSVADNGSSQHASIVADCGLLQVQPNTSHGDILRPFSNLSSTREHSAPSSSNVPTINAERTHETVEAGQQDGGNRGNEHAQKLSSSKREVLGPPRTTAVDSVIRRIAGNLNATEEKRLHRIKTRGEYRENRRAILGHSMPDWRTTLRDLELYTPKASATWHDNALKIRVPSTSIGQLLFGADDNIWEVSHRCGCQIELSDYDAEYVHRTLLLSGPVTSIAKASAEILQLAPNVTIDSEIFERRHPSFSTRRQQNLRYGPDGKTYSSVVNFKRSGPRRQLAIPQRADSIPKPTKWTPASMDMYIQHLTSIKMTTHQAKFLYEPGETHESCVISLLKQLYADPKCREAISTTALNATLAYFTKTSKMPEVRALFVQMELQKHKMNTETFNIMLRGAAKIEDLYTFQFILALMLRRGYTPDPGTWMAFLKGVDNRLIKEHIVTAMKKKELFHDARVQQGVCAEMMALDLPRALHDGLSLEMFEEQMLERYGEHWFAVDTASRMLHVLASQGLISSCWEVLEQLVERRLKPDAVCINTIIHHCIRQNNPQGAIEILRRVCSMSDFQPDDTTYQHLFDMAWRSHLYTVAKLIWCHACLNASTTYIMRKRVSESLRLADRDLAPVSSRRDFWHRTFGLFLMDIPITPEMFCLLKPAFSSGDAASATPLLKTLVSADETYDTSSQPKSVPLNRLLEGESLVHHTSMFKFWRPAQPFVEQLGKAYDVDREWWNSDIKNEPQAFKNLEENSPVNYVLPRIGHGALRPFSSVVWREVRKAKELRRTS